MGKVPLLNKETMSKRATLALTAMAAAKEERNFPSPEAVEAIDDVLSITKKMEFFGNTTKSYKHPTDPKSGAFCTVPVCYEFRDRAMKQRAFSSINCNSLNMSSTGKLNQSVKIYAITKLKTDIIFLSDIRLSNRNLISCSNEINKLFQLNPYGAYKFYFNSTKNKRGTGILIKNNLDVTVVDSIADPDENFLIQRICVSGTNITIGSIYGPNTLDLNFFERLKESLIQLGTDKVIIAGDWNCLYSNDPVNYNIDCLNMANVPNSRHSQQVKNICDELNLTDPYRFQFPNKKDYSYIPKALGARNRSRIDFFLVSVPLLNQRFECDILPNLQCKMFDHKACIFKLGQPLGPTIFRGPPNINKSIFKDNIIKYYCVCRNL
jgi:exonuclease III